MIRLSVAEKHSVTNFFFERITPIPQTPTGEDWERFVLLKDRMLMQAEQLSCFVIGQRLDTTSELVAKDAIVHSEDAAFTERRVNELRSFAHRGCLLTDDVLLNFVHNAVLS